jgi:hypothetical protein
MIRDQTNFGAGALFVVMGVGCSILSVGYGFGTPGRMGSGFFPFFLGLILTGLGLVLVLQSCAGGRAEDRLEPWDLRSLLVILAAVLTFSLLAPSFGLMVAIAGLVIVSSFADSGFRWRVVLATAFVLAVLCYVIFVFALELQLPVWPDFG